MLLANAKDIKFGEETRAVYSYMDDTKYTFWPSLEPPMLHMQ